MNDSNLSHVDAIAQLPKGVLKAWPAHRTMVRLKQQSISVIWCYSTRVCWFLVLANPK